MDFILAKVQIGFSSKLTVVRCAAGIMRNFSPMISRTRLAHAAAPTRI